MKRQSNINIELIERFLTSDIDIHSLVSELTTAHEILTELIMINSNHGNVPVCSDEIDAAHWLKRVKDILILATINRE